jgi:hypothetical protein
MNVLSLNIRSRGELELGVTNGIVLLLSLSLVSQHCGGALLLISNGSSLRYVAGALPEGHKETGLRVRNCWDPTHQEERKKQLLAVLLCCTRKDDTKPYSLVLLPFLLLFHVSISLLPPYSHSRLYKTILSRPFSGSPAVPHFLFSPST